MRFGLPSNLNQPKTPMKAEAFQRFQKRSLLKTHRFEKAFENGDEKRVIYCRFYAQKIRVFLRKRTSGDRRNQKQNKNASVSKIFCFVFTEAKTDTFYKKRALERIKITVCFRANTEKKSS